MKKYKTLVNFLRTVTSIIFIYIPLPFCYIRLQDTVPVEVVEQPDEEVPNPDEFPKPEDSNCAI